MVFEHGGVFITSFSNIDAFFIVINLKQKRNIKNVLFCLGTYFQKEMFQMSSQSPRDSYPQSTFAHYLVHSVF